MTADQSNSQPVPPDKQLALVEMERRLARYEDALANLGAGAQQAPPEDDDVIDLRELLNVLLRRRWTVILVAALVLVVGVLATLFTTPIYRATTVLQIDRQSAQVVAFQQETSRENLYFQDFFETQYGLLKSRTLARRVIDQLGLQAQEPADEVAEASPGFVAWLRGMLVTDEPAPEEESTDFDDEPPGLEGIVLGGLSVQPIANSRLVRLHFDSPDPRQASLIVNAVARAFIDMNLERRFEASTYATSFLEDRIRQVRADLEDSERALVAYSEERGIVDQEDKQGILMEKLRNMNSAQVQAETQRIEAESQYQEMLTASTDSLAEAVDNPIVQALKERRTELQTEYKELAQIFKPSYPRMLQLQEQITQVNDEIAQEIANIRDGIQVRYQAKLREEAKLAASIEETRAEIIELNARSTDFQTLKREVDTNRELYDGLLQRMKEVGVAAGITTNNISVVDAAQTPRAPYKPSLSRNVILALVLGLFAGCGLAFLFEMLDDSIKNAADLEKVVDKPVLGVLPKLAGKKEGDGINVPLHSYLEPTSALAEAHRSMRTALMFSTSDGAPKILHITSAAQGEGKTSASVNTATTFAATGSKVLLIDADLRNPSLHKVFNKPNDNGFSNYLSSDAGPGRVTQATGIDNLYVMTAGPLPPNPAELLHGPKMLDLVTLAARRFDYVIVDGPPLLGLADSLLIADACRATLLVAAAGVTRANAVEAGYKRLRQSQANVIGTVLTRFDLNKSGYGYGDDYGYVYSYGGKASQPETA